MSRKLLLLVGIGLLLIAAALFAWDANSTALAQDGGEDECDGPCPEWIVEAWAGSGHADAEAEAFRHWDEDDPAEVPPSCATCHSAPGYLDYLGADGTEAGVVDAPAPIDTVVNCTVCHNPVSVEMTSVTFPSGVELEVGLAARCMVCHQGRASGASVDSAVEELGLDIDESSEELGFINIHYFQAAASLYGSEAGGGYQYEGMVYQPKFAHVEGFATCSECHEPHTLELQLESCAMCHDGVASVEDLHDVRMAGSYRDYDGDGDISEGVYYELEGLQAMLYQAIQAYASEVVGTPIVYDPVAYPYFFVDTDGNGEASADEANYGNRYTAFTPRLLQATYNFQAYEKDPGAYTHNPKYYVQLMYDSIMSLNEMISEPVDLTVAARDDAGHFDSTSEAFRHWDEDGSVPGSCAKCHTAEGVPFFLQEGVNVSTEPSSALGCTTCHDVHAEEGFPVYDVTEVEFPSGAMLGFEMSPGSNICLLCHQGRQSTVSVNNAIERAGVGDDEVSEGLGFQNVHYFAAGATVFGSEAMGGYQFADKEYAGRFMHVPTVVDNCVSCHTAHELRVDLVQCQQCHPGVEEAEAIRLTAPDYDGDGDVTEGVAGEIETLHEELYAALEAYAADTVGTPIVYNPARYPYWFTDAEERYESWTPTLLRAAYNYQYVAKDPGGYAHNPQYVTQLLYDSLEALGSDVSGYTRP